MSEHFLSMIKCNVMAKVCLNYLMILMKLIEKLIHAYINDLIEIINIIHLSVNSKSINLWYDTNVIPTVLKGILYCYVMDKR